MSAHYTGYEASYDLAGRLRCLGSLDAGARRRGAPRRPLRPGGFPGHKIIRARFPMDAPLNFPNLLVARQLISAEELERVTKLQQEQHAPLSRLVVELGLLSEDDLLPVLRDHFDIPVLSLRDVPNT